MAKSPHCETTNAALEAMPAVSVTLTRKDGSHLELTAKLANKNSTRAAGFQRVCESTMRETPILFVFERELIPSFHMNNVVAPIDIAFITASSRVDTIFTMQTYAVMQVLKPTYSPRHPVIAALETHAGFMSDNKIGKHTRIEWQELKPGQ